VERRDISAAAGGTAEEVELTEVVSDRILTVPNVITFVRLCLLPVFLWLLFGREDRAAAAWLLAALGTTDFFDGWIARHFNQVSNLGKIIDPVADRLLLFVGVGGIVIDGSVPMWFAVAVLAREAVIAAATLVLAGLGAKRIEVTWFGKAGTFGLMVAFPLFLGSYSDLGWADTAWTLAWLAGIPGLVLSYWAAVLYVPLGLAAYRDRGSSDEPGVRSTP
jgi:cardiolipin synthase (CMP-forming)